MKMNKLNLLFSPVVQTYSVCKLKKKIQEKSWNLNQILEWGGREIPTLSHVFEIQITSELAEHEEKKGKEKY